MRCAFLGSNSIWLGAHAAGLAGSRVCQAVSMSLGNRRGRKSCFPTRSGGGRGSSRFGSGRPGHGARVRGSGGSGSSSGSGPGFLSGENNPFRVLFAWYHDRVRQAPVLTKAVTSFVGFALASKIVEAPGNGGAQKSYQDVLLSGVLGALVLGVGGHFYYGMMDRLLPGPNTAPVAAKIAVDFFAWVPFFTTMFAIHQKSEGSFSLRRLPQCIFREWKVPQPIWVMWSTLQFALIPIADRVLFYNGVVTLCALSAKMQEPAKQAEPAT